MLRDWHYIEFGMLAWDTSTQSDLDTFPARHWIGSNWPPLSWMPQLPRIYFSNVTRIVNRGTPRRAERRLGEFIRTFGVHIGFPVLEVTSIFCLWLTTWPGSPGCFAWKLGETSIRQLANGKQQLVFKPERRLLSIVATMPENIRSSRAWSTPTGFERNTPWPTPLRTE